MSGIGEHQSDTYSVHLPFNLAPGRKLNIELGDSFNLSGFACKLIGGCDRYEMTISGFRSKNEAEIYIGKICAGLIWFALKGSFGVAFDRVPKPVQLFRTPAAIPWVSTEGNVAVDGGFNGAHTTILPPQIRLIKYSGHAGQASVEMPVSALSDALSECLSQGMPEAVLGEEKLRIACEVYMSSHFENTPTAKFLSLISVLEILIPDVRASAPVVDAVNKFISEATDLKNAANHSTENDRSEEARDQASALVREYESLIGGLNRLRNRSIKSRIRQLVRDNWQSGSADGDATEASKKVSRLYDLRSELVHDGKYAPEELREGNDLLSQIVSQILRRRFRERTRLA